MTQPCSQYDAIVSDVYGEKFGWRMFDGNFLTKEVAVFLSAEKQAFIELIKSRNHIETIVEVGCGYGRFASSADNLDKAYIGLDLISWLVQQGEWLKSEDQLRRKSRDFFATSVLNLEHVLNVKGYSHEQRRKTVVFLPFNCLGNISYLNDILRRLSNLGVDVVTTLFDDSDASSTARNAYYANCGLQNLQVTQQDIGTYIVSEEGFDSLGFNFSHIKKLMQDHGYQLEESNDLSGIGSISYFSANAFAPSSKPMLKKSALQADTFHHPINLHDIALTAQQVPTRFFVLNTGTESPHGLMDFQSMPIVHKDDWKSELSRFSENHDCPICVLELVTNKGTVFLPIRMR